MEVGGPRFVSKEKRRAEEFLSIAYTEQFKVPESGW